MKITHLPEDGKNFIPYEVSGKTIDFDDGELMFNVSKKERDYAIDRLDGVVKKIRNSMQNTLQKIQTALMKPSAKKAGKEQIKEKTKESIYSKLARGKISADAANQARWEQQKRKLGKKRDMEI